jgi:hypothetical protein
MSILGKTNEALSEVQQCIYETSAETVDSRWKTLYRVGGTAALVAGLVFRRNLGAEFMLLRGSGILHFGPTTMPDTVLDWFTLLQNNSLLGLTLLNFFDIVNYALVGMIFLALIITLRRVSPSFMAIAAATGFLGIVLYFASNQSLSLLSLSTQYAAATTDANRSLFLAAGQAVMAIHDNAGYQGAGIYPSFFFISVAGLIISAVMLRSRIFNKVTAYMGILANVFGLSYYLTLAFAPALVFLPISVSAVFLLIWYILIGRRLLQTGKGNQEKN